MEVDISQMEYNVIMFVIFALFTVLFYFFIEDGVRKRIKSSIDAEKLKALDSTVVESKDSCESVKKEAGVVVNKSTKEDDLFSRANSLEKFAELYRMKYLSENEFQEIKREIIG